MDRLDNIYLLSIERKFPIFGFKENYGEYWTQYDPLLDSLNYASDRLEHHFLEHQTDLNLFVFW